MNERAEDEARKRADMNRVREQQRAEQEEIRNKKANEREAQREQMRKDLMKKRKQWSQRDGPKVEVVGAREFDEATAASAAAMAGQQKPPSSYFSENVVMPKIGKHRSEAVHSATEHMDTYKEQARQMEKQGWGNNGGANEP